MRSIILLLFLGLTTLSKAQKCISQERLARRISSDPELNYKIQDSDQKIRQWINRKERFNAKKQEIINIPVVVHVIWNQNHQNISEEQIQSQLDVLNEDFRKRNPDRLTSNHPFSAITDDVQIEFCLASLGPNGEMTSGITRSKTNKVSWNDDNYDDIFFSNRGGKDNWNPDLYLNIYVVEGDGETLGFASFPDELEDYREYDGVVIDHRVFGRTGTAGSEDFEGAMGRTATHEVGHWLNLWHIWGDEFCGDDKVGDTVPAEEDNYDCPTFPHRPNNECGSGPNGEMYMNYMDYVDDACAVMFTKGQSNRMRAVLSGLRGQLQNANGCNASTAVYDESWANSLIIHPNPTSGGEVRIWMDNPSQQEIQIQIFDMQGRLISSTPLSASVILDDLKKGLYLVKISSAYRFATKKLMVH